MQIALFIKVLVALLGLAAEFQQVNSQEHFNESLYHVIERRSGGKNKHRHREHLDHQFDKNELEARFYQQNKPLKFAELTQMKKRLTVKQSWDLIHEEWKTMNGTEPGVECCPSVLELIEPVAGRNSQDNFVELYSSESYQQRFYELSCHKSVLNLPCRFMQKQMHEHSRCVQMYSLTYALVKDTAESRTKNSPTFPGSGSGNTNYTLDYIKVRSGCACMIVPPKEKENKKKKKNHKNHKKKEIDHNNHPHRNRNEEVLRGDEVTV